MNFLDKNYNSRETKWLEPNKISLNRDRKLCRILIMAASQVTIKETPSAAP